MTTSNSQMVRVILADDDPDDRMFFQDATIEIKINIVLKMVNDGEELMQLLLNPSTVVPEIIFIDLNMPRKNGLECLAEIRNDPRLKNVFVVIYSTTGSSREIVDAYNKGANLFVNKLNTYTDLKIILKKVFSLNLQNHILNRAKEEFILLIP